MSLSSVLIGYCRPTHTFGVFTDSLARLISHDATTSNHLRHPDPIIPCESGPRVADARNEIVRAFLNTDATHLLMLDVDLSFPADLLDRLLAHDKPFTAGLYFARVDGGDVPLRPLLGVFDANGDVDWLDDYPRGELVKAHVTGAGCLLMHRDMLMDVGRKHSHVGETPNRYPWFIEGMMTRTGNALGEDMAFCGRVAKCGWEMWVDTGVGLGHVKTVELSEQAWWAIRLGQPERG